MINSSSPLCKIANSEKGLPPEFKTEDESWAEPYEIGWLHLAPCIKATVYVYDKGRTDIPANIGEAVLKAEFAAAVSELRTVHPESTPLSNATEYDAMIRQTFLIDGEPSVMVLGLSRGKFIKIRVTSANDPMLGEVVEDSLTFFRELVTASERTR